MAGLIVKQVQGLCQGPSTPASEPKSPTISCFALCQSWQVQGSFSGGEAALERVGHRLLPWLTPSLAAPSLSAGLLSVEIKAAQVRPVRGLCLDGCVPGPASHCQRPAARPMLQGVEQLARMTPLLKRILKALQRPTPAW